MLMSSLHACECDQLVVPLNRTHAIARQQAGRTALHYAVLATPKMWLVQLLLKRGADPFALDEVRRLRSRLAACKPLC